MLSFFGVFEDNQLQSNFMSCVALFLKNNYKQEHFVLLEIVVYCVHREGGREPVSPAAGTLLHLGSLVTGPMLAKARLLDRGGQWNLCLLIVSNTVGHRMQILASQASPLPAPAH